MVLARGRMGGPPSPPTLLETEFLRTRPEGLGGKPVVLSLRALRGREEVAPCWCSFCWCRRSRSRRAKQRWHCGHSNGFSLVCERSCRFRCSSRANDRVHVVQMCGRGLSVFGGGKVAAGGEAAGFAVWTDAAIDNVVSQCSSHVSLLLTVAAPRAGRVVAGDARGARKLRDIWL